MKPLTKFQTRVIRKILPLPCTVVDNVQHSIKDVKEDSNCLCYSNLNIISIIMTCEYFFHIPSNDDCKNQILIEQNKSVIRYFLTNYYYFEADIAPIQ